MQPLTSLRRVSRCGRVSVIEGGSTLLRLSENGDGSRTAGVGGVERCGSIWACPCCSAKIAAHRAWELEKLLQWNASRGGTVALLTLTMRHHSGHRMKALRKALTGAWRHVTESRAWKEQRRVYGRDHYVRAIEATHGENGWHLHIHALLFFDGPVSRDMIEVLTDEMYELWATGLASEGMEASRAHGIDVRVGSDAIDGMGRYLSKLTFEAAGGRWKKGRQGGRTPYEILDEAINQGNADDWDLWLEWERGSHGMRQLSFSRGLKATALADEEDLTDEQVVQKDEGGRTIAELPARTWSQVWCRVEELLEAAEQGGVDAAWSWLDQRRLSFDPPGWTAGDS